MAVPLKAGLFYFKRMMTTTSTPVVLTIAPGWVTVASQHEWLLNAALPQVGIKRSRATGAVILTSGGTKLILAGLGANNSEPHSEHQIIEVQQAQALAATDPDAATLELGRMTWIGHPVIADGTKRGSKESLKNREAQDQSRISKILYDALLAAGGAPV